MKVTMHINVEVEGEAEIQKLSTMTGQLEDAFSSLVGKVNVGATRTEPAPGKAADTADTADTGADNSPADEPELLSRKTYCLHKETGELFILEKGDTQPGPDVETISKKRYEDLLAEQETPEQETPEQETPEQETPEQETPEQETPDTGDELTLADVQAAFKKFVDVKGAAKAKAVVQELGVSKLSELEPSQYAEAMDAIKVEH